MIKSLPKSFEMKGNKLPYLYTDLWITNGKFACKRSKIKDSYRYCLNNADVQQPEIERLIPASTPSIAIGKTDRLYAIGSEYARVFVDEFDNEYLINDIYVQTFNLDSLYTSGENSMITDFNLDFLVMPMNRFTKKIEKVA